MIPIRRELTALTNRVTDDEANALTLGAVKADGDISNAISLAHDGACQDLAITSKTTLAEVKLDVDVANAISLAHDGVSQNNNIDDIIRYIQSRDTSIRSEHYDYSGPVNTPIEINLMICDGAVQYVDIFNSTATVVVSATGSGVIAESMPIQFINGRATIHVNDAAAETTILSLSGGNTSLDKSDTANAVFS